MIDQPARSPRKRPAFTLAALRARHDGWTAARQTDFIEALAESGCVDEACKRVGMSVSSAYALRRRIDASSFRQAWDHALDFAIRRLSDAAFSRAINGVARPVFYKGEQVGERRHYDERLTQFLLRYRDPVRYGAWLDDREARRHPEGAALTLAKSLIRVDAEAFRTETGRPPRPLPAIISFLSLSEADLAAEDAERAEAAAEAAAKGDEARREASWRADLDSLEPDSGGDVA